MSERLSSDLQALLGAAAFVALTQEFGGTRLYVPLHISSDHDIAKAIGADAARRLSARFAPAVIRVPLARAFRAKHYKAAGLSHARIASRLGLTETGVDKLFARMDDCPAKGAASTQLSFFDR